jgi:hypothetical protein
MVDAVGTQLQDVCGYFPLAFAGGLSRSAESPWGGRLG